MAFETLQQYQERTSQSPQQVADQLSALLGKRYTIPNVARHWRDGKVPPAWVEALNLPEVFPAEWEVDHDDESLSRESEHDPRPLRDSPVAKPALPTRQFAEKRITALYAFVGAGIGEAVHNPGVTKVWDDGAPGIAKAWLDAAETSDFARRFVNLMSSGGPMGEVVMLHVTMFAGTLYVLGQFPDVGLFGQYRRYRPPDEPAVRSRDNGAAPASAASPVGAAAPAAGA